MKSRRDYTTEEDRKVSADAIIACWLGWVATSTASVIIFEPGDALFVIFILTLAAIALTLGEIF